MKQKFIFFFLTFFYNFSFCQDSLSLPSYYTFIGELRNYIRLVENEGIEENVYARAFLSKGYTCIMKDANTREDIPCSFREKEGFYKLERVKGVEVVINVPLNKMGSDNLLHVQGGIQPKGRGMTLSFDNKKHKLTLQKFVDPRSKEYQAYYINDYTYKLQDGVYLSSPEEVTVDVTIDFINYRLQEEADSIGGFSKIVEMVTSYVENGQVLTSTELINLYRLLHFIKPYVHENSFLNDEARKLDSFIVETRNQLSDSISFFKLPIEKQEELSARLIFASDIYIKYENFIKKINAYYEKLRVILFLKTPSQYNNKNRTDFGIEHRIEKEKDLRFTIGTGLVFRTNKIYDVTISKIDTTVQFQKLSSFSPIMSAGLLWKPFTRDSSKVAKDSNAVKDVSHNSSITVQKPLILGVFLNYHVATNISSVNYNSTFGLGFGLGYSSRNWSIMGMFDFRNVRQPRQFFIDAFEGGNRIFFPDGSLNAATTIDLNDNSIFTNQVQYSLGVTFNYIFDNSYNR